MKNKKINNGDLFLVKLLDGTFSVGQVLDLQMKNIVRIALFDINIKSSSEFISELTLNNLISLLISTVDKFNNNSWEIIGNEKIIIPINLYPNEKYRNKDWVGSITHGSAIVESFLNAFYNLSPWDIYFDIQYFDKLLFNNNIKPLELTYSK